MHGIGWGWAEDGNEHGTGARHSVGPGICDKAGHEAENGFGHRAGVWNYECDRRSGLDMDM